MQNSAASTKHPARMGRGTSLAFEPATADELRRRFDDLRQAATEMARIPLQQILNTLGRLAAHWTPEGSAYAEAKSLLSPIFSARTVAASLQSLVLAMQPAILRPSLARELGRLDLLDTWQSDEHGVGLVRGFPLGVVAQVLAGNVFLGGVIALAHSLLTRNAVFLKLSSKDSGFTELFLRTLIQEDDTGVLGRAVALCAWSSAREDLNDVIREQADGVVVWGGQAAMEAYPAARCRGRVIHYGPRLGIGFVLQGVDLARALPALAWDVALWEQQACSSPRLLFVEETAADPKFAERVAAGLSAALTAVRVQLSPRTLSLDDKAEVLSVREMAVWHEDARVFAAARSMDHTVLLAKGVPENVPLGYRTVRIVPFADVALIGALLRPYQAGLQTAVLAAPAARWPLATEVLAAAGISQIAAAGSAAASFLGLPHEGEYALRRLIRLVGVDLGAGPLVCPGRQVEALAEVLASSAQ